MRIRWSRKQLRSNRQAGELLCPHTSVKRPWIISPSLIEEVDGRTFSIWSPGPSIRECCVRRGKGLAIAAWWWEVGNRFEDLKEIGLPDKEHTEYTEAILDQRTQIEENLAYKVPSTTPEAIQRYIWYREDIGLTERRQKERIPHGLKILGLQWPCTKDDVLARWKELALQVHPDHGGDRASFQKYFAAYSSVRRHFDRCA